MQRYAEGLANETKGRARYARRRECSRPRDNRPANATYVDRVAASPDVNRSRFARFVARSLASARDRGMTDKDIHAATGIPPSTFHRWQKGQFATAPDLDKVKRFCEGLGVSLTGAMTALGMAPGRDTAEPEPPLPPEIRTILRRLADPNVRESDKLVIREMLKLLAQQARERREPEEGTG